MSADTASIATRIRSEVERALQRNIKGLQYLSSSDPEVGSTPRELVTRRGTMGLYRYKPLSDEVYRIPLLVVMALTNRGYVLDLAPGQSLVEFLLRQGYDVYMIDWASPRADEKRLRIEDYTHDFLPECVARVQETSGVADVNLVGYCMGGLLSTLYLASHARSPVKSLAVFTTPIDFDQMKLFSKWSDKRHFDVDRLIAETGNAPPELIYGSIEIQVGCPA